MPQNTEPRVALYFDFDNIVISRYDQIHGEGSYRRDTGRRAAPTPRTAEKLAEATVDLDAVLDFAATFGTIALSRAYADWSTPVNASYRGQLIARAVDLVQLFPLSATKNGADIRLAIDAVEDLFRIDDLTHVVIVAGDSDYVALAQRCKRLGRYVIGIGVAGGTSRALAAACDEFADYDALLTTDDLDDAIDTALEAITAVVVEEPAPVEEAPAAEPPAAPTRKRGAKAAKAVEPGAPDGAAEVVAATEPDASPARRRRSGTATKPAPASEADATSGSPQDAPIPAEAPAATTEAQDAASATRARTPGRRVKSTGKADAAAEPAGPEPNATEAAASAATASAPPTATRNPGRLLRRALELMRAKNDEEWQPSSAVKQQMLRMDPGFQERALGFASFTDFLRSRASVVELDESEQNRVRIRPGKG